MTALTHKENDLHNRLIVAEFNLGQVEEELRRLREENEALRARLAQPEREWQGLTTQEITDETDIATSSNKDIFDLRKAFWCGARWAEDKLKEKNT